MTRLQELARAPRRVGVAIALCLGAAAVQAAGWFEGGRPTPLAHEAVALLTAADSHGLAPRDYGADRLAAAVARHRDGKAGDETALARELDLAMQRYLSDLRYGRIDPRQNHARFDPAPRTGFDPAARLRAAMAGGRLDDAVQAALPPLPLYGHLREALAHYRTLAGHPAWRSRLPALPGADGRRGGKLAPYHAWPGLDLMAQRLAALGDLVPALETVPSRYDATLVQAVRAFQERHGLAVDGVVGPATLAQLQVPPAARVRQIELTLERLRWTPLLQGPRMVVVNIPEFMLRAYEVQDGRIHVRETMKIIVGDALDTRTPLFDEDMRFIEFSPYWNIPPSIARDETVPRLRRDPAYFARQGLEFVGPGGAVDTVLSAAKLDAVLAGRLRIRQRPGPENALGDIKFVFPNASNIYLHHTPATALFSRDRRDLSHGCIRVEHPVALARFVLQGMPEWTEERIRAAMGAGRSSTLRLSQPLPVLIAYGTTLAKNDRIFFFDDIYGLDRELDAALRQRSAALNSTPESLPR